MTSYLSAIAMCVLSVNNSEIIVFEFSNVLDSNLWPWKWRSRTLTIWMKIAVRTLTLSSQHAYGRQHWRYGWKLPCELLLCPVNMHMGVKIGDLNENCRANSYFVQSTCVWASKLAIWMKIAVRTLTLSSQHAYGLQNWRLKLQYFVPGRFRDRMTYVPVNFVTEWRTYVRTYVVTYGHTYIHTSSERDAPFNSIGTV